MKDLSFRGFQGKSEFPRMAALLQANAVADHAEFWPTAESLERDYEHLINSTPATDMLMVENPAGELIAYARVEWQRDSEDQQVFGFPFNIHPDYRSVELAHYLLQWVEKRSKEVALETNLGIKAILRAFVRDLDMEQHRKESLELEGFQTVRFMNRMRRDLAEPIDVPPMPEGLEIRPVPETHYRATVLAMDEAFRDHWGHSPFTDEMYEQWIKQPNLDPSLWKVAWAGDEIAAGVLNFIDKEANTQFNIQRGWTDPIFTRRPWRKRGLAHALIMRSLQMFKEMGMTEAMLGVDTQNPSGAYRLYESCGFKSVMHSAVYEKDLA